ncbi:alpha/beta hydrolase [Novosphingobium sp. ZW T3_23]|uniref:alpha/beta hydrolase n=1 Tax=Novosphingobium sp. ZW T3_23 TaxID=3378084 RepID=UPI0038526BA7
MNALAKAIRQLPAPGPSSFLQRLPGRFLLSLCGTGVWLGTLFFAASLTPSLVPRSGLIQGVLSGVAFALGYGVGAGFRGLWRFLRLPPWDESLIGRSLKVGAAATCILIAGLFLWRASEWQNSVRLPMGMAPVDSARPVLVGALSLVIAILGILLARLFKAMARGITHLLDRVAPRRVSAIAGTILAAALFWSIGNGLLLRAGIRALDASYRELDSSMDSGMRQPADPLKTGSEASLLKWADLGLMGRSAIAFGPTRAEIERFTGQPAMEPLRIYAGLRSAGSIEERAALALAEMQRVGAFDRSVLVIATPTGTGWLDPASQMPLEYLHRGDVATVAVQYSYLPSWLALMVEPDYGADTARALFRKVYDHWHKLPRDRRPRLYLHGLSLGALNSDLSADLFDVIGDPHQGALWSGPPFQSRTWLQATHERSPRSPAWLPRFRDGSVIRFTGQRNALAQADAPWGPMRIVYLQYASDPITFFETQSAFRPPAWMKGPRGPDVSPELRWYPLVTFLQHGLDMVIATTTPMGHGHVYAPEHYVDAWIAVTQPRGWTPAAIARLKSHVARRVENQAIEKGEPPITTD